MAREREVGTLWIGGALSWMEQLCLKSFVDQGQKITLFAYEDIPNIPEGVILRDGREVIDTDDFIKYEQKNSFALFADLFRLHMIQQNPGMIWVDTDVYCHRPMDYDSDYVFGFELPGQKRVNNAVLGLPADSEILRQMLDFTADRTPIPPFLPPKKRKELQAAADAGAPVHVSQLPWGVWGPMMVTHYVHALGLQDQVQPLDAFYPVTFRERTHFMKRRSLVTNALTDRTTALHLWASNKRQLGNLHGGLPPKGSYLDELVGKHGIVPSLAPIMGRGQTVFDSALLDAVDLPDVAHVAELTGGAKALCLALHHKFDCDIHLINVSRKGVIGKEEEPWIGAYVEFLTDNDVHPDRIHIVESEKKLKPADVVLNLSGFGDRHRLRNFGPLLDRLLHADSRLFMDIRKGSGGFPFLKNYGENTVLSTHEAEGKPVSRVRLTPVLQTKPATNADAWAEIATSLAGKDGWYRDGPEGHSFLFTPQSRDTLVVTFDNLDITMEKRDDRRPWGYDLITGQGWSMLGVLAGGWTWYRNPWVAAEFDRLRDEGFFNQFGRVVFYGASMGGYAAAAFSPAAPGCDVVAISPQSTVDKSVVPWETRYKTVWDRDFTGPYGDAAAVSHAAREVTLIFDPYEPLDARHAARFTHDNVRQLRAPLLGHRLGSSLNQMGILSKIILGALDGSLSTADYYQLLRKRRDFPRYQRELFNRAVAKGHKDLARNLGRHILTRNANPAVRRGLKGL